MISIGKSAVLGNKNTKECAFGVFSNHNSQFLMFLFAVKFGNQDIILQNLKNQDNILQNLKTRIISCILVKNRIMERSEQVSVQVSGVGQ